MKTNSNTLDTLIRISISSLFILPFLVTANYFPLAKFYPEIITAIISMIIFILIIYQVKHLYIPHIGIACFLFTLLLLIQIPLLHLGLPGINCVAALEFGICTLLSIAIASYSNQSDHHRQKLIELFLWAIVISAIIQSIYGLLQITNQAHIFGNLILFINTVNYNIFGNFGQRNDYANFICMGILALTYLFFIGKVNPTMFIVYLLFFMYSISISASRTPLLYFLSFILISWYFYLKTAQKHPYRQLIKLFVILFITFLMLEISIPVISKFLIYSKQQNSGLSRIYFNGLDYSSYRRFYEWYKCIKIFIEHPILGIGWFQYPAVSTQLMLQNEFMYTPQNNALFSNSHNLICNILAETGIIGFLIFTYGVFYSIYKLFIYPYKCYTTPFIISLTLTILIHSMFEFPMWELYFLIFFIFFLSLAKPLVTVQNSINIKIIASLIFIIFIYLCISQMITYRMILIDSIVPQSDPRLFKSQVLQLENISNHDSLLSLPARSTLDLYIIPTDTLTNNAMSLANQVKYTDILGKVNPTPPIILKQIILHKLSHDESGSSYYASLLTHAYPQYRDTAVPVLNKLTEFTTQINIIEQFNYQDKSTFSKLINSL